MSQQRKLTLLLIAGILLVQASGWGWWLRSGVASGLPAILDAVLEDLESSGEFETISEKPWVILVCSENWASLRDEQVRAMRHRLPQGWGLASEDSPPPGVSLTSYLCVGCTVVCVENEFTTPLVTVADSVWWHGNLAAEGFRHVGFNFGPWWWPIKTWSTWLS